MGHMGAFPKGNLVDRKGCEERRLSLSMLLISLVVWTAAWLLLMHGPAAGRKGIDKQLQSSGTKATWTTFAQGRWEEPVFTFVHLSDIHVSRYLADGHIHHLHHFVQHDLSLINPFLVLATGDLTDAKDRNKLQSRQFLDEWVAYSELLRLGALSHRRGERFWFDQV